MSIPLSPKRQRFVEEYLVDFNASAAYIRAGYSKKGADVNASRLLGIDSIQEAVKAGTVRAAQSCEVSRKQIQDRAIAIAFSRMDQFAEWGPDGIRLKKSADLTPELAGCVRKLRAGANGEISFELKDDLAALRFLAQLLGVLVEKTALTDPTGKEEYGKDAITNDERAKRLVSLVEALGWRLVRRAA